MKWRLVDRLPGLLRRGPKVAETVTPSRDEVSEASRLLTRHRAEAQRALIRTTTLKLRAELGLPMPEARP